MRGSTFIAAEGFAHGWLVRHSIGVLRVTMGLVFLGFGALKFIPGASPAQDLAVTTTRMLTFGTVPDPVALVLIAALECVIGLSLIAGRGMRVTIYLLALELLGILSPLVLLPLRLFPAPNHFPTLEGQYVLKDIVLVGAAMVVATTFRGARIALAAEAGTDDAPTAAAGDAPVGGAPVGDAGAATPAERPSRRPRSTARHRVETVRAAISTR